MNRRALLTAAGVGVLALAAVALVVLALLPRAGSPTPRTTLAAGEVAAAGDSVWRWVGPDDCNDAADAVPVEVRRSGGPWESVPVPLANVQSLSFGNSRDGVATGTTSSCARGVAVTDDGGRTWVSRPDHPVLLDAWFGGRTVWGIERAADGFALAGYRFGPDGRLLPVAGTDPIQPCGVSDGPPVHVAFWTSRSGLVLCQSPVMGSRLLARTTNGGASFEAVADDRPQQGLDGSSSVTALDVAGTSAAWVVFGPGGECPEGQIRASNSAGASFTRLPCPSSSARVQEVLDVSFTSPEDGVLLALRDGAAVLLQTSDGGRSWQSPPGGG